MKRWPLTSIPGVGAGKPALRRGILMVLVVAMLGPVAVLGPAPTPAVAASRSVPAVSTYQTSDATPTQTSVRLTYEAPHEMVSHETGSGEWTFVVDANKQVRSVRIAVAEGPCAQGGEVLWETKVTDDELASGSGFRSAAFEGGSYCSHLLLKGVKKAQASVTITTPEVREPDRDPDPDPDVSPSPETSPSFEPSPSPSATSSPSPDPSPSPSASTSPTPTPSPSSTSVPLPVPGDEYSHRCSDDSTVDHRVLAGAVGPDPDAPFIYQRFYPSTLQVREGDLVEWCMNAGLDWHTISFSALDMDVASHPEPVAEKSLKWWRWDETGALAFHEEMLFGHELGDESAQCGRGPYYHLRAQPLCVLSSTKQDVSSSLWDEFFSIMRPGQFRTKIDLPPGSYRYFCKIHYQMNGFIQVVPEDTTPVNPTRAAIDNQIAQHHAQAEALFEELSDPSTAYNFEQRRWEVWAGATTSDRSVNIQQFMPARIDVAPGDQVHYIAGADEPNTVTFPGGRQVDAHAATNPQGGFSANGECGPHSCRSGTGAPWGMVGLAFVWSCDPDDRASGVPGNHLYVPAATTFRTADYVDPRERALHGCRAGALPELLTQPWYGGQQRAPGDLVVGVKTFHNSGTILDPAIPEARRTWESNGVMPAGKWPGDFDARFPTKGTFKYFCAAHEFMNGMVVVR